MVPTIGLSILGVAVENNTSDLVLDCGAEATDRGSHDRSTLAVAAADDDRVRALGVGEVEEALGFAVCGRAGACTLSASDPCGTQVD